jgi:hypothetical protein
MDLYCNKNIIKNKFGIYLQNGYGQETVFEGYTFNLNISKESDLTTIFIESKSGNDCVTVLIYKDTREAILQNLSYFENCAKEGLKKPGGGKILFLFIVEWLIKHKKQLDINRIILTDNSYLACDGCKHTVKLSRLYMILYGYSWYNKLINDREFNGKKYIFYTCDTATNKISRSEFEKNKNILNLEIKNLDLKHIVIHCNSKYINTLMKYDITEVYTIASNHIYISSFIKELMLSFNKYCCFIEFLLNSIFMSTELGLYDPYKKSFCIDIST